MVVGPNRQDAVDAAARLGDVLVVDGPLQLAPRPADLALLVVDAEAPWGSGACPPRGDLRAPSDRLLAEADVVVRVVDPAAPAGAGTRFPNSFKSARVRTDSVDQIPVFDAETTSRGVHVQGRLVPFSELGGRPVGLVTGLARPGRVRRFLERRGVHVASPIEVHDHGFVRMGERAAARLAKRLRAETCDLWLTTAKCAAGLGPWLDRMGVPFGILDHEVRPSDPLRIHLESRVTPRCRASRGCS
ncbi:MAG: tetraacyldisaccharide 4'-kinase [Polyangiaceae bacterium]